MSLTLETEILHFPLAEAFSISRGSRTEAAVVEVRLSDGAHRGRGECVPYARYGEDVESVRAAIEALSGALAEGLDRAGLQTTLPAGAARNALDCAFWDLEAKRAGRRVWELDAFAALAGRRGAPGPEITAYTLSLAEPAAMRAKAEANAHRPLLKIKLGGEGDVERLRAVRAGAAEARIVIDANEGWTAETYAAIAPVLLELGVAMVEQPLPARADAVLASMERPLPVCADEACHDRGSLTDIAGRYDMINIKLDKTGGLTEALALRAEAEAAGYAIMVGCMIGSSLAMAPAQILAQGAAVVDLDAPLLLARDRAPAMTYDAAGIHPPPTELWG